MRFACMLGMALLLAVSARAADVGEHCDGYELAAPPDKLEQKSWYACESDADCEAGQDICGAHIAVAVKQHAEQKRFVQCMAPSVKCSAAGSLPDSYKPACVAHRCQMALVKPH